jgi:hypothetical protein
VPQSQSILNQRNPLIEIVAARFLGEYTWVDRYVEALAAFFVRFDVIGVAGKQQNQRTYDMC